MKITFTIELLEPEGAEGIELDDVGQKLDLAQGEIVHLFGQPCYTVITSKNGRTWRCTATQDWFRRCP